MPDLPTRDTLWTQLNYAWGRLLALPVPDGSLADEIGDLEEFRRRINARIAMLTSEETEPTVGQRWARVEQRRANRTYNLSRIFAAVPMMELWREGAVTLDIGWTKLKKALADRDISLTVAAHEVADGDEEMVGEVWTSRYTTEPVEEAF